MESWTDEAKYVGLGGRAAAELGLLTVEDHLDEGEDARGAGHRVGGVQNLLLVPGA
jgi:hypothetical protein